MAEGRTFDIVLYDKLESVNDALPKDFNKSRFVQNALSLFHNNKDLAQKYKQNEIMTGLLQGAYLGLDFLSSECYLVPYGSQLKFMPSYKGSIKLSKKYSIRPIKDIYAKVVREGDDFAESVVNGEPTINFTPLPFNSGKTIGAFAVCLFEDGGMIYETMSLADLENTRSKSKMKNAGIWKDFTNEMYKKTVIHRLCKSIEIEFDNANQLDSFNSGMELADARDTKEVVAEEIKENANTVDFDDVVDAEVVNDLPFEE